MSGIIVINQGLKYGLPGVTKVNMALLVQGSRFSSSEGGRDLIRLSFFV